MTRPDNEPALVAFLARRPTLQELAAHLAGACPLRALGPRHALVYEPATRRCAAVRDEVRR